MTNVHYFPRYSQRENFETNNTLLLFHRLYDYNRFRFEKLLAVLLRNAATEAGNAFTLGLQIKQQVGTGTSVVDGYLHQDSFRIAIETKRSADGFTADQIGRHVTGFSQTSGGFLFLLSPEQAQIAGSHWESVRAAAIQRGVVLIPITFEDLIAASQGCLNDYDEEMRALVTDYEDFCSEEGLLPVDKWTLFTPPCGRSYEINVADRLYFCPASWSRRKARYLGVYYDKAVRHIGRITKLVECEIQNGAVIGATKELTSDERQRILHASGAAMEQQGWDLTTGTQFFLCDEMHDTMFRKSTPGGIMGHRYFDLRSYLLEGVPDRIADLAERLRTSNWE
ncbi:hypothetical protein G8O24_42040 [Bradyrhizobium sp. INPA01-394B]|uniref:Restriction endonuclease type IV Mrr domain-containing protein n=1 Tax=Bradyrhizobium campsiandrae TaxID=1729892 RepID=A0ABR7U035_9BRAD|nr:hypothetical protein [Bradyrhizobium campsiandrae]MBC9883857.1 hypothetical protein [Bradyrhizobium campsiandrae]MBC9976799.1 hypothetical protein [Bradyrhizobium campsiandrae]